MAGHPVTGLNMNNSAAALVRAGLAHRMATSGCSATDNGLLARFSVICYFCHSVLIAEQRHDSG